MEGKRREREGKRRGREDTSKGREEKGKGKERRRVTDLLSNPNINNSIFSIVFKGNFEDVTKEKNRKNNL